MRTSALGWIIIAACTAPAQTRAEEGDRAALQAAERKIASLEDDVASLRQTLSTLRKRLDMVEQRVGLRPFKPVSLKAMEPGRHLRLPKGVYLDGPGARGRTRDLAEHVAGFDAYVVAFWATWCKPCVADKELRALRALQGQLRRRHVELVSVAVDDLKKVKRHPKANAWLYPLWQVADGHIQMLPKAFIDQVGLGLPLFVVVSRAGEMRYFHGGALDPRAFHELITAAESVR